MTDYRKRLLLIIAVLIIAAGCAFGVDRAAYQHFKSYDAEKDILPVFTDGSEAFGNYSCEIDHGYVRITGGDPQFYVNTNDHVFSMIHMYFKEPLDQDVILQVFFAPEGIVSESNSVWQTLSNGKADEIILIPKDAYSFLRFDFEKDVYIDKIEVGNREHITLAYKPHFGRIGIIFGIIFVPLCVLILVMKRKKDDQSVEYQRQSKRRFRKPEM